MIPVPRPVVWAIFATLIVGAASVRGAEYSAGPDNYLSILSKLQPGDTLSLQPAQYPKGLRIRGLHGNSNARIVIQGPRSGSPAVLVGRPGANTVSLGDASYITIRDLRIDGAHMPVDGIKAEGSKLPVHHITLERLTIVNVDYSQDVIAISTKCPAWGWIIRENDIIGAGTGLYLGDSDGTAPFLDGLLDNNVVIDTVGYGIEIKHQIERPELSDMPTAPSVTILRYNVFAKSRDASVGKAARPNVLVGHFPLQGSGHQDHYEIVANVLFDNPTEALFQGEGNVTLARNLLFNPNGDAVAFQPHHDRPRVISIVENFVGAAGRGIAMRGGDPELEQEIARNAVYAADPLQGGKQRDNEVGTFAQAPAGFARWLALARERRGAEGLDRARLSSLARRACELTAVRTPDGKSTTLTNQPRHPVCDFLRNLQGAQR